jgi:phosphatidate cytidylyltransferase
MVLSNLTTRILVAIVGIPAILAVTLAGGYLFFAFIALVATLALHEFYTLARAKGASPQVIPGLFFGFLFVAVFMYDKLHIVVLHVFAAWGREIPLPTMAQTVLILLLALVPAVLLIELFRNKPSAVLNIASTIFGVLYVSMFLGSLVGLRELFVPADFPVWAHFTVVGPSVPEEIAAAIYRWGGWTVVAVFAGIWACDSAAYFAGRGFGRHKLFERVSPKKTWEGAVAGLLAAIGAFLLMRAVTLPYLSLQDAIVCGAVIGVFGQSGDLVESLMKRDAGVKDSSSLLPGHGGILDRFDSLIFVSPLLFFYLDFVVF